MFLLALLLAFPAPAWAQPADCASVPVGPPVDLQVFGASPGRPGMITGIALPPTPAFGSRCVAPVAPPADVLRGPPAPNGLLQGNGPRDVLHNRLTPEVVVGSPPSGLDAAPP
jgi:hypothetical protein